MLFAHRFTVSMFVVLAVASHGAFAAEPTFRMQEVAADLEVGYAVNIVDMNQDRRPDIVVVDTNRVIWYENPSWKMHTLIHEATKRDNVCLAPYDVDADGRIDFALGADWRPFDTQTGGTIQWLSGVGGSESAPWVVRQIAEEPTTHRMRWADIDGDGRSELIVVPLMGRGTTKPLFAETPVRVLAFSIPADPARDRWPMRVLDESMHVCHNFQPLDFDGDRDIDIVCTSFEGVNLLTNDGRGNFTRKLIGAGNQTTSPNRGASEIKVGKLAGGARYIATIEPWHGHQVVVYTSPVDPQTGLWTRHVLDEELKWGHAVWCANIDGDADEELVIGVRDDLDPADPTKRCGVRVYDPVDVRAGRWTRTLVDAGGTAIEDLAAADFDGNGRTDLVAVGRRTRNVRIYWNETK